MPSASCTPRTGDRCSCSPGRVRRWSAPPISTIATALGRTRGSAAPNSTTCWRPAPSSFPPPPSRRATCCRPGPACDRWSAAATTAASLPTRNASMCSGASRRCVTLAGGKLTTFRPLAVEVLQARAPLLGRTVTDDGAAVFWRPAKVRSSTGSAVASDAARPVATDATWSASSGWWTPSERTAWVPAKRSGPNYVRRRGGNGAASR